MYCDNTSSGDEDEQRLRNYELFTAVRKKAAEERIIEDVRLCLQNGAEINAVNIKGETVLDIARDRNYENLVAFLSALGGMAAANLANDSDSSMAEQQSDIISVTSEQPIPTKHEDVEDIENIPPGNNQLQLPSRENKELQPELKVSAANDDTVLPIVAKSVKRGSVRLEIEANRQTELNKTAIDLAWENKHYDIVLALLKADSDFPIRFDPTVLNTGGTAQWAVKEFAEIRDLLHGLIVENHLEDIKDYTDVIGGSRRYLNSKNQSALFTATKNKRFEIFAFLKSVGCVFRDKREEDCVIKLSKGEKDMLRMEMMVRFPQINHMHVFYLTSKSRSQQPVDQHKIEHLYRCLDAIPEVSIILKVILYVDHLEVIFDFENILDVNSAASKATRSDYKSGRIYIAATTDENKLLGTLANELMKLAMYHLYKNDCNPFGNSENTKRKFISAITSRMRGYTEDIVRTMDNDTRETSLVTLAKAFIRPEDEQQPGLIAMVPHILAQHRDLGRKWLQNTNMEIKLLFDYYIDQAYRCSDFVANSFLINPRSSVQVLNEYLKEVNDIINYGINFDNFINLNSFLRSSEQVFLLRTRNTLLSVLSVYQSLTNEYGKYSVRDSLFSKFDSYADNQDSIHDLLYSATLKLLCVRYTCDSSNARLSDVLGTLNTLLGQQVEKKAVFIVSESRAEEFEEMKRVFYNKCHEKQASRKLTLNDLTRESQKKVLRREVMLQGETMSLKKLIGKPDRRAREMVDAGMVERLIADPVIEIGSRPLGTVDMEAACSELIEEVDIDIFIDELLSEESTDIYVISGIPSGREGLIEWLLTADVDVGKRSKVCDLESRIGEFSQGTTGAVTNRIQVADDQFEKADFKHICRNNRQRKVYWVDLKHDDGESRFVLEQIYDPDFYFKCDRFNNEVVIEKNVKEHLASSTFSEIFVIGGKTKEEFSKWLKYSDESEQMQFERNYNKQRVKFLKSENNAPATFQEVVAQNRDQTCHLFRFVGEHFVWCATHGSLANLSRYRCKTYKNVKGLLGEDALIAEIKDERVVIIAGDLGTGKSTALIKLCELKYTSKFGEEESMLESHWFIKVNLKNHLDAIRDIDFSTPTELLRNIADFLLLADGSISDAFAKGLLVMALAKQNFGKPLLIAFDGFDEILDKADRNKVISLLERLRDETSAKFWITTRLYYQQTLESALSTFAIKLGPFDDEVTGEFVAKCLRNRLSLVLSREASRSVFGTSDEGATATRMREYTVALLNKICDAFKGNASKLIGTPLRLYLTLEGSEGHFKEWVEAADDRSPDFSYLGSDMWEVYENFVDRRYIMYLKRAMVKERWRQEQDKLTLDDYHKALAKSFLLRSAPKESLDRFRDMALSAGIVRSDGSCIEFVHSTFKDYFAAKVFLNWAVKWKAADQYKLTNLKKQEYLFKEILVKSDYRIVRNFLNIKLLKENLANVQLREECYDKKVLHIAAKDGNIGIVRFVLENFDNASSILNDRNQDGRTVVHVAAMSNNFDMVKYLVNEQKVDLTVKDKFRMTALHMAVSSGNLEMVKFLANEKDVDLLARGSFGMTPLHTAANRGHLDIVRFLVDEKHIDVETKDDSGMTVLQTAANSDSFELVKFLVEEKGADLDAKDEFELTVLHTAAECGNLDIFKFLVNERNANFNARDSEGLTILHTAATFCNFDIFKFLVNEKNADFTVRDNQGRTVLHTAAIFGNLEMVKFLVNEKKADINITSSNGRTILHMAADSGHMDLLRYLVEDWRADLSAEDKFGMTVLHTAATTGNLDMVKYLVDANVIDFEAKDEFGMTILQTAADSGNMEMVTYLMNQKGVNVEAKDDYGMTVLHTAVTSGHFEMVKFLVDEKKADFNARDDSGLTALHTAATFGNLEMTRFLVDQKGADFNAKANNGKTVLHMAVEAGHLHIVKFLVDEKMADLTAKDKCDVTVLHAAASFGQLAMVKFLLEGRDVDLEVRDKFGMTVLNRAANSGKFEVVKYLMNEKKVNFESKDVYGMTVLHTAVTSDNLEMVKFIVNEKHIDIETRDNAGMTVLHTAATFGNLQVVKFLVREKMANLNAVSSNGKTALYMAADTGNLVMVEFLISENSINLDTRLSNGRTVLHAAADSGSLEMVKLLVNEKGVNMNIKDYDGMTVLHTAAKSGHLDTVKFLVDEKGVNFNARDNHGKTVVHIAAMFGNLEMVKFMINEKNSRLNAAADNGVSFAPKISGSGHLEIVKYLIIEKGSDFNAAAKNDKTVLQMAVTFGDLELIEFLVEEKGVNFEAEGNGGMAILRMAAECGNLEVIKFLINDKKSDSNAKDLDLLAVLHTAASFGKLGIVKFLVNEKHVGVEERSHGGRTILHTAAESGFLAVVKFLIKEKGADINVKDNNGLTVLHAAAKSGHLETVKFLVEEKGVDPNAKDNRARSVLLMAANSGNLEMVKYLIYERKVNFEARDINDWTLLNWGRVFGYYRIVEFLKNKESVVPLKKFKHQ